MDTNRASRPSRVWTAAEIAGWLTGALWLAAPYNLFLKFGNGNLGHNVLISVALGAIGIAIAVPLTRWLGRRMGALDSRRVTSLEWAVCASHVFFVGAAIGSLVGWWPGQVMLVALAFAATCALMVFTVGRRCRPRERSAEGWLRRSWSFNGAFWIAVFVLLAASDIYAIAGIDGLNWLERSSAMLERLANQAVLTIGLMLLFHGIRSLTPLCFRPVLLVLFSLLPCLIVADFMLRQMWNQSLLAVVNFFTSTGAFEFDREVAAAGLNWTIGQVSLVAAIVLALCVLLFVGLGWLSRSAGFRTANRHVFRVLLVCWLVAVAEGALSYATKRTEAWQKHYKAFDLHVGVFSPPRGLETMTIELREPLPKAERDSLLARVQDGPEIRKPDVYVFMIESWRSDSVVPEVAPFLSEFRDQECQDLGTTFAGSNCTPLSWFSFLHSRVAVHWADSLAAEKKAGPLAGAYPVQILDSLDYEIHVRAVCDLYYKNLGPMNFGEDNVLADRVIHHAASNGSTIPQREVEVLADLKTHLDADPERPQFHFVALDSPHYNYYWPEGFDRLHQDCATNVPSILRPSDEVIGGVVRRYENSVHWVDYAIEEFVDFLKFKGRYEDSVIIITGDHGEEFQEEGSWFHCSSLNRYQTEVPIIIKWPSWVGDLPAQDNVTHLDVMPSLLELMGLEPEFYEGLSGSSLLRYPEEPREAVISTVHRGETGVGLCIVRGDRKAKFSFAGPWSTNVPSRLHLAGYSDMLDKELDYREFVIDRSHSDYVREEFPAAIGRFFERFETR